MAKLPKRINTSENNLKKVIEKSIKEKNFIEIDISSIKPPKYHDRKYINKHSIFELSQSIRGTKGLIYPIVVRELKDGTLERLIGYRRIEAYKLLNKDKIPAIILKNVSDKQALLLMTTENMQRENLSLYDETLALVDYVAVSLDISSDEVLKLLNRIKNFKSGVLTNGISESEKKDYFKVEKILENTGKITVSTLINRVKKTNVHPMLQSALSKGDLTFAVAQVLNEIKDEKILQSAIEEILKNNYSKRETQQYLNTLIPQKKKKNAYSDKLKRIANIKIGNLEESKKNEIDALLDRIFKIVQKD